MTEPLGARSAMVATITTNLMGPIRMTSVLIEHLKGKSDAVVAYTSSVLGFVLPTSIRRS